MGGDGAGGGEGVGGCDTIEGGGGGGVWGGCGEGKKFSKVLYIVTLYGKGARALIFENLCKDGVLLDHVPLNAVGNSESMTETRYTVHVPLAALSVTAPRGGGGGRGRGGDACDTVSRTVVVAAQLVVGREGKAPARDVTRTARKVCIHMCVCVCVYIYIYLYIHIYIHTYMYVRYACVCAYIRTQTLCVRIYAHTHTYHTYIYVCNIYIQDTSIYI